MYQRDTALSALITIIPSYLPCLPSSFHLKWLLPWPATRLNSSCQLLPEIKVVLTGSYPWRVLESWQLPSKNLYVNTIQEKSFYKFYVTKLKWIGMIVKCCKYMVIPQKSNCTYFPTEVLKYKQLRTLHKVLLE